MSWWPMKRKKKKKKGLAAVVNFFTPRNILKVLQKLWKRMKTYFKKKKKTGFTMIELLIVLAMVGIFSTAGVVGFQASQQKSRDATRKGDLNRVKVAFEDYYNDNNCYPPAGSLNACGSSALQPYLHSIPCDPLSDDPYLYAPLDNACAGYRLHASLENNDDPDIAEAGCDGDGGCGYGSSYNFGIASGTTVFDPEGEEYVAPASSPQPSQSPAQEASPSPSPSPTTVASPSPVPSGGESPVPSPVISPSPISNFSPVPFSTPSPAVIGNPVFDVEGYDSQSATVFVCASQGNCLEFYPNDPFVSSCPVTYEQSNCNNECDNPALSCLQ